MITCVRDDLVLACIFYLKELLPKNKIPNVDIDLYKMHTLKGWCAPDEDGYQICLDSTQPIEIMLTTLAHECVHIKQYVMKELVEKDHENFWFGEKVEPHMYDDYYNLPWEKEAYNLELELLERFIRINN